MLEKIFNFGTAEGYEDYLNGKIRITNLVSIGLLVVAAVYSLFSLAFYPALTYLPAAGFLLVCFGMFMMRLHMADIYRIVICFVPTFIALFYHRGLLSPGEAPLSGLMLLQGAFSLLPFMLFDLRERKLLLLMAGICFMGVVFFKSTEGWLDYDLDAELFRSGLLHEITLGVAMVFLYGAVFIFSFINRKAEQKGEILLEESRRSNEELNKQGKQMELNLARLEEAQEEERRRAWASEGLSRFSALMRRSGDNPEEMYHELLSGIIKYIDANQAALYIVEGEGSNLQLELKACYAYNRKKHTQQTVRPGQGLLGQAYLEQDYIYMTEVPQGYTRITSGLGDATPGALLIVPLMSNDTVEGMLELASFKPFEKYVIDFLMTLGEDIASGIGVNRINVMTRQLLEKSQQQTEELRSQEEEMRQNMEELSATQEEMYRKELELGGQIEAINASLATIEFDLEGNILKANDKFLQVLGYSPEQIMGRHHRMFVDAEYARSAAYATFWRELKAGNFQDGEFTRVAKNGDIVCLSATYTPVKNAHGEVLKILKLAREISLTKQLEVQDSYE